MDEIARVQLLVMGEVGVENGAEAPQRAFAAMMAPWFGFVSGCPCVRRP